MNVLLHSRIKVISVDQEQAICEEAYSKGMKRVKKELSHHRITMMEGEM